MTWDKSARYKIGPQNLHELHVRHVYEDPDFAEAVSQITDSNTTTVSGTVKGKALASKYAISTEEIDWFISPLRQTFEFNRNDDESKSFQVIRNDNLDKRYVYIRFRKNITKEDYMMSWDLIMSRFKKMPAYNSKIKLPEEYKIVYAIFKARQREPRPSFTTIFIDYQKGELEGFNEHANYFTSKDSLERYYNRYKPTI